MQLMPCRVEALENTLSAYRGTAVPLVQYVEGRRLAPAGFSDDPGIYLIVPRLAQWLNVPVTEAIGIMLLFIAGLSLVTGLIGWYRYSRSWTGRLYGAVVMAGVTVVALKVGDIYVMLCAAVVGLVPPILAITRDRRLEPRGLAWFLPIGLAAGAANLIRSQSGTAVVLFGIILVAAFVREAPLAYRGAAIGLLVAGMLIPSAAFGAQVKARDAFLASRSDAIDLDRAGHPMWHSVYIGFGYLENPWVPEYRDEVAIAKVEEVDPSTPYLSVQYEGILRDEVIDLVEEQPVFVARTLLAKTGVVLGYLLLFLNVGIPALVLARRPLALHAAFIAVLCFEALFGLLVVPMRNYLLGFFAMAVVYAMVGVDSFMAARKAAAAAGTG